MTHPDVAVVGLGPAGRALAHRLLGKGLRVLAVDPDPDRRWTQTFGGWERQLPAWLPAKVVGARAGRPALMALRRHQLPDEYVVLETAALQGALDIAGAEVRGETLTDEELAGLAPVVVDCRGSRPVGSSDAVRALEGAAQTAYGLALPAEVVGDLLGGEPAVLMDWRPFDGASSWGRRSATFCYTVPLPDGRVLAEETCLAGAPPIPSAELERRLSVRLARHGVPASARVAAEVEHVHIPLLRAPRSTTGDSVIAFGAAGAQLNPISGYSVFSSLAAADDLAAAVAAAVGGTGRVAAPAADGPGDHVRRAALAAVTQLGGYATVELFDAFARLSAGHQRTVLDPTSDTSRLVTALGRQWWGMSPSGRAALVAATAAGASGALPGPLRLVGGARR